MASWSDRVHTAAVSMNVSPAFLSETLSSLGIDEIELRNARIEDFRAAMSSKKEFAEKGVFLLNKAYRALLEIADAPPPAESSPATLLDIINVVRVPNDAARKAYEILKAKRVRDGEPRTWGDVHFVVLEEDGNRIDRVRSQQVIDSLSRGDPDYCDGVFVTKDEQYFAAFRLDDVMVFEKARRLYDPFCPTGFLNSNKVSPALGVVIDLDPDRHQLLLFAIRSGLVEVPKDERAARELLRLVSEADSVEAAAIRLGKRLAVRWAAARRAPPGTPAALPSVVEPESMPPSAVPSTEAAPPPHGGQEGHNANDPLAWAIIEGWRVSGEPSNKYKLSDAAPNIVQLILDLATPEQLAALVEFCGVRAHSRNKEALVSQVFQINPLLLNVFRAIFCSSEGFVLVDFLSDVTGIDCISLEQRLGWRVFALTLLGFHPPE